MITRLLQGFRTLVAALPVVALVWVTPLTAAESAKPDFFAAPFVDGSPQWAEFINDRSGWRPFAEAGFLGSSTVVGNVEAGRIWTGHEVFARPPSLTNGFIAYTNPHALNQLDFHATTVGHVLAGSGYDGTGYQLLAVGMAPEATVLSAGVATSFSTNNLGSFDTSYLSVVTPYRAFMTGEGVPRADVINSSWGGADPAADDPEAVAVDGLAAQNASSALVASAGNSGVEAVGWPGSGFNTIAVGALGQKSFLVPADFTSRGLVDFFNPATGVTTSNARVAVDLAAPGENFFLAAYLGNQGGIAAALPGLAQEPPPADLYFINSSGTSYASPMVAGGLAVLKDVANRDPFLSLNGLPDAQDTRVTKSVLQAGALETFGWDNGQTLGPGGARVTTQSLDAATGAGALDLMRSAEAYFLGTRDVDGPGGGGVLADGWDFGAITLGGGNDYPFAGPFGTPVELTVSLNWFAGRTFDMETNLGSNLSFADLNLEVWEVSGGIFSSLVGASSSVFNNSEYLRLDLAGDRSYGLRVTFDHLVFDLTGAVDSASYGLAWVTQSYDSLAWSGGGVWDGLNVVFTNASGTATAVTTALDVLGLGGGAVAVEGPQLARGMVFSGGTTTVAGTNGGVISLDSAGLEVRASVAGDTVLDGQVAILLSSGQTWSNASAHALAVEGAISGRGDLALHAAAAGDIRLSGRVDHLGSLLNNGTGTGRAVIDGMIGTNVTAIVQDSTTSRMVIGGGSPHEFTGTVDVRSGMLTIDGDLSSAGLTQVHNGGILSGRGAVGDLVIASGGTGSPGNSPGTMDVAGDLTWLGGGNYNWEIHDATGLAGHPFGWDFYNITGQLDLTALSLIDKFSINLATLSAVGPDVDGPLVNFDAAQNYSWTIATAGAGILGFDADFFQINTGPFNGTAGWANDTFGGVFGLRVNGNNLDLIFTTGIPEPGTWLVGALLAAAAAARYHRGSRVSRSRSPR